MKRRPLSPVLRRLLLIGTNAAARDALRAPTRRHTADALADLRAAQMQIKCLIGCLQTQERKETRP